MLYFLLNKNTPFKTVFSFEYNILNNKIPLDEVYGYSKSEYYSKNFYKDSKKVDNKKMKEFFNHKLKYPTYVEGLNYIFNNTF